MERYERIRDQNPKEQDLTVISFTGKVTGETIMNALMRFYETTITTNVLWDFSDCDVTALTSDDLILFVETAKKNAHRRPNGKSAFIGPTNLTYGLGRMYTAQSQLNKHPIINKIFRTEADARAWLNA